MPPSSAAPSVTSKPSDTGLMATTSGATRNESLANGGAPDADAVGAKRKRHTTVRSGTESLTTPPILLTLSPPNTSNCEELESSIKMSYTTSETNTSLSEEYVIHQTGSQKGKPLLVARTGYGYVVDRKRGNTTYWRCSIRSKANHCPATMTQDCDNFRSGRHGHSHAAPSGIEKTINVITRVIKSSRFRCFSSDDSSC